MRLQWFDQALNAKPVRVLQAISSLASLATAIIVNAALFSTKHIVRRRKEIVLQGELPSELGRRISILPQYLLLVLAHTGVENRHLARYFDEWLLESTRRL
jgi:hypothetical protein